MVKKVLLIIDHSTFNTMNNQVIDKLKETFKGPLLQENENANVGKSERILSVATGAFILFQGITNIFSHPLIAIAEVAVGGSLMQRGVTGYCAVKAMMDRNCEDNAAISVERAEHVTVL